MKVRAILAHKGSKVVTVRSTEMIQNVARRMRMEHIGAAVVSENGRDVSGLISEREIAWGVAEHGAHIAQKSVSDLMSVSVTTCTPESTVAAVMQL